MSDPVMTTDGTICDRAAIERCPQFTKKKISSQVLLPVGPLKILIDQLVPEAVRTEQMREATLRLKFLYVDRSVGGKQAWYVNQTLEVKTSKRWRLARIQQVMVMNNGTFVHVHFDGYRATDDRLLNVKKSASRFAPLHTHIAAVTVPSTSKLFPNEVMVVGCRLRAMDFGDRWYAATVIELSEEHLQVKVHYQGWSSSYDEWFNVESDRLCKIGSVV